MSTINFLCRQLIIANEDFKVIMWRTDQVTDQAQAVDKRIVTLVDFVRIKVTVPIGIFDKKDS